jgi:hypothetical protein
MDNKRIKYTLKKLPSNEKTLLDFAKILNNVSVARFTNIKSGKTVQLSNYNMSNLLKNKKCYGKLCETFRSKASFNEFEIYDWNKHVWLLVWMQEKSRF